MTQGERVREIRKTLGLTLEKFGERLGVGKTAISKIEKGENKLTTQMLKSICSEYRVNYKYLESGIGDPFSDVPRDTVDALCQEFHLDAFDKAIIEEYLRMDERSRRIVKEYIRRIARNVVCEGPSINEEVAAYRDELLEEKNLEDGSSVSGTQLDA